MPALNRNMSILLRRLVRPCKQPFFPVSADPLNRQRFSSVSIRLRENGNKNKTSILNPPLVPAIVGKNAITSVNKDGSGSSRNSNNTGRNPDSKEDSSSYDNFIIENALFSNSHYQRGNNLVRCTVFDSQGNVKVVSGEFKRTELLNKHGLLPRDLRKLDTGISNIVPTILVRKNSILANLLHIRALIKCDNVFIFDVYGSADSQTQSVFMYDLGHKLKMGGLPYELLALEAIFVSVITALDAEMQVHTAVINGILSDLENDSIDREKLWHLLVQNKKLSKFLQKATLIRDAMAELLDQDEDLAGLYLTEKAKGLRQGLPIEDHSEAEIMIESYYKHCDEIVQTVENLVSNIRSTEEIVNIILDANRNSLMLLSLRFQVGTLSLATGSFIAAAYGMNLVNFIEQSVYGFVGITSFAVILSTLVGVISLRNLFKLQRITMMSTATRPKRRGLWSFFTRPKAKPSLNNKGSAVPNSSGSASSASTLHPGVGSPNPHEDDGLLVQPSLDPGPAASTKADQRMKGLNWLSDGPNIKHY